MSSAEPPLGAVMRAQPAWKREILERKRAKLAGAAAAGVEDRDASSGERLVVAESLGPLRENPFMRLENERRRLRGCRDARPLQQLLELYSSVPGIRTIRADNILIIESQPAACFAEGDAVPGCRRDALSPPPPPPPPLPPPPPCSSSPPRRPDPLRELLARRGAALAEIRAEQVVIYESAEPPEAAEPGTVSRLLEKFGQRPRGGRRRRDGGGGEGAAAPQPPAPLPSPPRAAPQPLPAPPKPIAPPQPAAPTRAGPSQPPPPRAAAPQAAPGPLPRAATPQHASPPRAATPPPGPAPPAGAATVPQVATPQPSPLQPVPTSPRAATPQPVAPPSAVPVSPRAATPQPVAPPSAVPTSPRAVTPQPVAPPSAVPTSPRAVTPQPVAPPSAVPASPRAVTPQPVAPPSAAPSQPAAPLTVPSAPRAVSPKPAAAPQANCFLHKIGSNSFTVTPRGLPPGSRLPEPRAVAPGRPSAPKGPPVPSAGAPLARANTRRPKPEVAVLPGASLAPSATAAPQPLSAAAPRAGGSFHILPAPKPDLAAIPAHDLQAQALAKLRLNSRNSFVFVPRQEGGAALSRAREEKTLQEPPRASAPEQEEPVASRPAPLDPSVPVTYIDDIVELESGEVSPGAGSAARTGSLADRPGGASAELEMEFSSVPLYRPHSASSQRGGSTFTVVPKRKPLAPGPQALADASARPQREEEEEDEESKGRSKAVESVDGPPVGTPHKKRYPTVNEIEVIGGYLSLERSCMSKTGSRRKKMKISFNEKSLQTMFEYPSESSLAEEEDEEEAGRASETEENKSRTFYIPRPNGTLPPSTPNSDLSSYTPKHSVKFSEWQEQKYEEMPAAERPLPKEANSPGNQVMLTPAEKGGLSDFSSEPALYF
ncbi:taperin isoform X2 [Phaenicophaeus curvirostris]|uniref:taperin isoform X2 n=1 Tax=Phaenicophaeus curvirostris TaxID=33595 RepID=UPI0037F0F5A0